MKRKEIEKCASFTTILHETIRWNRRYLIGKYSLGMRQRLGLAQAIMEDPKLLILDEPFNGLDRTGAAEIRSLLLQLKSEGKTILLSSHNQTDIDTLCDTVLELDIGKIQCRLSQSSTAEKHSKPQP